jgi:large subunit ribosomal protein L21
VTGALLETRKGEKVKIFKKIRRQGYRRTRGHRQTESVVRVTSVAGAGKETKWEGVIDLTPKVILNARARGLGDAAVPATIPTAPVKAEAETAAPKKKAAPKKAATEAAPEAEA